jgi:hypothetical protein
MDKTRLGLGLATLGIGVALVLGLPPNWWSDMPPELVHIGVGIGLVLIVVGLAVAISSLPRHKSVATLGPWVLIIGGPLLGLAWLYLGSPSKSSPPSLPAARAALLHNWPDPVDRANLRAILRNISEILNRDVSPIQLGVHQHLDNIRRNIGTPAANVLIGEMAAFQTRLLEIRTRLIDTYVNGQDYADEAWDVLENTDAIYGDAVTLDNYVKAVKGIQVGPTDQLIGLLAGPENAVRETNGKLGDWVGVSIRRLRRKQDALDN